MSASMLALALASAAIVGLASCGGGGDADLLPGATASEITTNLERVRELSAEGECIGAEESAQEVSIQIDALGGVDKELKLALREGAERLALVVGECEEEEEAPPVAESEEEPEPDEKKEKKEKPEKHKPEKEPPEEQADTEHPPELPPQSNGKGKGLEEDHGEGPPSETGGVGPATPAGED